MQFNKRQFKKENEKKILRKVKKEWVVVSLATLMMCAGGGLAVNQTMIKADENISSTKGDSGYLGDLSESESDSSSSSDTTDGEHTTQTDAATNSDNQNNKDNTNKIQNSTQAMDKTEVNKENSDELNKSPENSNGSVSNVTTNSKLDNENTDNSENKNINSVTNSGNNNNEVTNTQSDDNNNTNANNYEKQTLNPKTSQNVIKPASFYAQLFESKLEDNQSLSENSDEYKYAVKGASDAMAGVANATVTQPESFSAYYNAGYQGVIDARNKYNEATQNYGTNDKYSSFDDSKTDSTSDAAASSKQYEQNNLEKLNKVSNYSVDNNNGKQLVIPNKNNLDPKNIDTSDNKKMQAYAIGANTFLATQGANDAKSGKWNGIVQGGNGNATTASIYNPDANSTNPYDQAYLGAISAMNAQWKQLSGGNETYTVGNNYSYTATSDNQYFKVGVDSVVKDIQAGTVFVKNVVELYRAAFGNSSNYQSNDTGTFDGNVKAIKLINDIFMKDSPYIEWSTTINSFNGKTLSIDGQNHIYDAKGRSMIFSSDANSNLEIKNFKTMYGYNYFGNFRLSSDGNIYFSNVNYVGPQFISATSNNVYLSGNINAYQTDRYYSPFGPANGQETQNAGDEELFEVNNMTVQPGAHFYGRVASRNANKNAVTLQGNLSIGNNAQVTLVNRSNYGIYFGGASAQLNILKNAHLNIIPSTTNSSSTYGAGMYSGNNTVINIDGGKLNIEVNGQTSNPVVNFTSNANINVYNKGIILVNQGNIGTSSNNNVFYAPSAIVNIANQSKFKASADGSQWIYYLYNVSKTNIINSEFNLDLSKNTNSGSQLANSNIIDAYSANYKTDPNGNYLSAPFYKMSFNPGDKSITYTNTKDGSTVVNSQAVSRYIDIVPTNLVTFNGPVSVDKNTIAGYFKVYNNDPNLNVYAQFGYYDNSGNFVPIGNPSVDNSESYDNDSYYPKFNGKYDQKITLPNNYSDGKNIAFSFNFDPTKLSNLPSNPKYGVLLRYGTSIITTDVSSNGNYNVVSHGYNIDNNKNITNALDVTLDRGTNSSDVMDGQNNGTVDKQNYTSDNKDIKRYGSNSKYTNAYDSAMHGYQAYLDNNSEQNDPNKNTLIIPSDDTPIAYIYGYNKAKADAIGYTDGENDFKNDNSIKQIGNNNKAYYDNYLSGYNDFKAGYNAYLNHETITEKPTQSMQDGINYAADAAQSGSKVAINKGSKISDNSKHYNKAFNQGYDSALQGVLSFEDFDNPTSTSKTKNKEYDLGFNTMKEYAQGYQQYLSSPNEYDNHKAMSTNLDAGYVAAYNANQDVQKMVAPGDDTKNQNIMYQTIYYKAYYNAAQNTFNDNDKHVNDSMQAVDDATNTATQNNTNAQQASDTANKTSVKTNYLAEKYPNNPTISSANQKAKDAATSASDTAKQAADAQSNAINASNAAQKAFDSYQAASQAASDAISEANSYANAANSAAQLGDVDAANKAHEASKQASQKVADALNKAKTAAEEVNKQNTIAQDAANTANTANNNAQTAQDNAAKALDEAQKEANKIDQVYTDGNKAADDAKNKNNQINGI
ncbi:hypothetical protein, partial [Apilactobacillus xinyiensis]|uniref:hypothetical protein n=1 Tax=Apilactobacillus xinyiensis TaxID=2841032 RepID=UPI00200E21F6